ncbi:reverse transcriptase domain-containing protein [Tanacetum coccineum]
MFETKVVPPPDSPPIIVVDPDDQPMWSSTKSLHQHLDNQFDGQIRSNPHRYLADFLEISNLFQYGENQEDTVMLRTFPFSLSGEAKIWLNEIDEGTITSWNELREAFISLYKCLLNDILNFHQLANESLVEAWLRFKEMIRTCYGHCLTKGTIIQIFYRGLDDPTQRNSRRRRNLSLQNSKRSFENP